MVYNWQSPRKNPYPKTSGYLVIDSDDGSRGDYDTWYPLLKSISYEYSQFYPANLAFACLAINTGTIGNSGKITWDEVKEMNRYGWEINSHGRYHVGIGKHVVTQPVTVGDNRIYIQFSDYTDRNGIYNWRVWEGEKEETFKITGWGGGYIDIDTSLVNSYTTESRVQIVESDATEELQGAIVDLQAQGICASEYHYVYPYHSGGAHNYSPTAVGWVASLYSTARARAGALNTSATDKHRLFAIATNTSQAGLDSWLQQAKDNNSVMIWYGHGDAPATLEYLVRKAIEMGISIISRQRAFEILTQ